jgi:hypothetical protein
MKYKNQDLYTCLWQNQGKRPFDHILNSEGANW